MKEILADTRPGRGAVIKRSSFNRIPGPVSKKKLSKEIDELLTDVITEYVRLGNKIILPYTFKSVLKARILRMIEEGK